MVLWGGGRLTALGSFHRHHPFVLTPLTPNFNPFLFLIATGPGFFAVATFVNSPPWGARTAHVFCTLWKTSPERRFAGSVGTGSTCMVRSSSSRFRCCPSFVLTHHHSDFPWYESLTLYALQQVQVLFWCRLIETGGGSAYFTERTVFDLPYFTERIVFGLHSTKPGPPCHPTRPVPPVIPPGDGRGSAGETATACCLGGGAGGGCSRGDDYLVPSSSGRSRG